MHIRAEHILAILVTGIFLLVDFAVLCFFVTAFNAEPNIVRNHMSSPYGYAEMQDIKPIKASQSTFGGTTKTKAKAVDKLEETLSTQIQTLTQTKDAP